MPSQNNIGYRAAINKAAMLIKFRASYLVEPPRDIHPDTSIYLSSTGHNELALQQKNRDVCLWLDISVERSRLSCTSSAPEIATLPDNLLSGTSP